MARSRLKHGKACNVAKQRGIDPKNVLMGLTRGNTNNQVNIITKSDWYGLGFGVYGNNQMLKWFRLKMLKSLKNA